MHKSQGIEVIYSPKGVTFDDFVDRYVQDHSFYTYFSHDGFCFYGPDTVLAPSSVVWHDYVASRICEKMSVTPIEFNRDALRSIIQEYKIQALSSGQFIENVQVSQVSLYEGSTHTCIAEIAVKQMETTEDIPKFPLYKTVITKDQERLSPLISFVQQVLQACGNASSVTRWICQIGESTSDYSHTLSLPLLDVQGHLIPNTASFPVTVNVKSINGKITIVLPEI